MNQTKWFGVLFCGNVNVKEMKIIGREFLPIIGCCVAVIFNVFYLTALEKLNTKIPRQAS